MNTGSMSSAAGSLAKTSALPGRVPESTGSEACFGRSTLVSFAHYAPDSSSWRTCQLSLVGGWVEFLETWPRAGMTRNGTAYRLPPLVPRTSATACSLLPTPTANDAKNSTLPPSQRWQNSIPGYLLRSQFPTPKASDGERAAGACLTDDGTLLVRGVSGTNYPVCLDVVDRLCDLGWLGLYDVDEVRVTQQGAYWAERFAKLNRVRR